MEEYKFSKLEIIIGILGLIVVAILFFGMMIAQDRFDKWQCHNIPASEAYKIDKCKDIFLNEVNK